jgi:hypothetical protein
MKGQEIYAIFEWDDPAIEQVTRPHLLASKVID